MAERFEIARMNILQPISLLLYVGDGIDEQPVAHSLLSNTILPENDFIIKGSFVLASDCFGHIGEIHVELKHIVNDDQLSLEFTNPGNIPFQNGFKSVEGAFQVTKEDDATLSTRTLIMDVNTCNNFDCTCDRKQFCYQVKSFCRLDDISKYIVEKDGGQAGVKCQFSGRISSYGGNGTRIPIQGIPSFHVNYTSDTLPDLIIKVAGKEFPGHKAILAGQSDAFLSMFTIGTREAKKGIMEMKDSTADGVKGMFNFLYKRELEVPSKTNIHVFYDMFRVAEKYNIQSLKEALVEVVCLVPHEEFDLDNAIQFFIFAQRLQSRMLENKAFQIFQMKRVEIRNSKSVTSFFKENTELAEKLLAQCLY